MDGSDSEALEQLRDLTRPLITKLLLPLINSFHSGFFFYRSTKLLFFLSHSRKQVVNVIAFLV